MKIIQHIATYLLALMILLSCTEEIDIDLNSSDPQIVIEGSISTTGESVIKISRISKFR
jgi:hypothetical protein